ncbi:MAG: diguanylate cyclase, partial [Alphaproteobacteria bacterium]|nr:diguanylate cyclase [Alphaproteobacteria bacterium]
MTSNPDNALAIALWDKADTMHACNDAFAAVLPAVSHLMVPGTPYETLMQAAVAAGAIASATDDPSAWLAHHLARQGDGEWSDVVEAAPGRWYRVSAAKLTDGSTVIGWADVSADHARARELQLSEARYRDLLELTPTLVLVLSGEQVLFCNAHGARVLGYDSADALQGMSLTAVLDRDAGRLRHRDGSLLPATMRETPLDDGGKKYTLLIAEPVTDVDPADRDSLTGLPGRAGFLACLRDAVALADRGKVALLLIDLDHFKTVNDTLGHAVGDRLLCEVAARLSACLPADGFVARIGGDEFAVIHPDIEEAEQASALVQEIEAVLAEPVMSNGQALHTGGSIGITLYPDHAKKAEDLLKG